MWLWRCIKLSVEVLLPWLVGRADRMNPNVREKNSGLHALLCTHCEVGACKGYCSETSTLGDIVLCSGFSCTRSCPDSLQAFLLLFPSVSTYSKQGLSSWCLQQLRSGNEQKLRMKAVHKARFKFFNLTI